MSQIYNELKDALLSNQEFINVLNSKENRQKVLAAYVAYRCCDGNEEDKADFLKHIKNLLVLIV